MSSIFKETLEKVLSRNISEQLTGDEKQAIDAMVELLNFCDYERLCQLAKADIDKRCLALLKNPKSH